MSRADRDAVVLARGLFTSTARLGDLVVRRPRWWCRFPLGQALAGRMRATHRLFRRYLPVPATRVIEGRLGDFAIVQRYVAGAVPLRDLPDARLYEPAVAASLRALLADVERCYAETGWLPDVGGRVHVPGELYDVRRTDNLVLGADGRWWLVDAGATALFHCRRWPTGWVHTRLMLRAVRRFARELGRVSARTPGRRVPACGWTTGLGRRSLLKQAEAHDEDRGRTIRQDRAWPLRGACISRHAEGPQPWRAGPAVFRRLSSSSPVVHPHAGTRRPGVRAETRPPLAPHAPR